MDRMKSESLFQHEVMGLLSVDGHVQDHRLSNHSHVPDMSASYKGWDVWLELKWGRFKFGHDRYDDCEFKETTRGQLDWLIRRQQCGSSLCGILGYIAAEHSDFIVYIPAQNYLNEIWKPAKKLDVGGAAFKYGRGTEFVKSADDLLDLARGISIRAGRPTGVRG